MGSLENSPISDLTPKPEWCLLPAMHVVFKGLPAVAPGFVRSMGRVTEIRVKNKDGTTTILLAPDQARGFLPGDRLPYDIVDPRAMRHLSDGNNPMFGPASDDGHDAGTHSSPVPHR